MSTHTLAGGWLRFQKICGCLGLGLAISLSAAAQEPSADAQQAGNPPPSQTGYQPQHKYELDPFYDEVTVSLQTLIARVVDRRGEPIYGLGPEDLQATVGGQPVPITAVDWYSDNADPRAVDTVQQLVASQPGLTSEDLELLESATDRLVVIFVQIGHHQVVSLDETYISGHLKLLPHLQRLLDDLAPGDQVAVVSYDFHLKVWLDFTLDRQAVQQAIYDAIGFGTPNTRQHYGLSLLEHLDVPTRKAATSPEKALLATAQALEKLPGIKDLIFAGWGLGRYTHGVGVLMPKDFDTAVSALGQSQTTVSVLDVVQTDTHALSAGLVSVANATGGTYASTYDAVGRKVDQLSRTLKGYYVISLDRNTMPQQGGKLKLSIDRKGARVVHRSTGIPAR